MDNKVPVLFIIFNRLEIAKRSFEQIRKCQPSKLYIASDGPRKDKEGEADKVELCRSTILGMIDWPCEVHKLFRPENVGCGQGVYSAVNWLFETEEMGIILEDDCVINDSFYPFMTEMLERYKDDNRIGMVAGTNPVKMPDDYKYSYLFSNYKSCWGWGTWKRAWSKMDYEMKWLDEDPESVVYNCGFLGKDVKYWKRLRECCQNNRHNVWDHHWYLSLAANNQLTVYPAKNLVSNIGCGAEATNTWFTETYIESFELAFPLVHKSIVAPSYDFDKAFYLLDNNTGERFKKACKKMVPKGIKNIIKKIKFK